MIDLSKISPDLIAAKGKYSIVRSAHEDAKNELAQTCSGMQSINALILKRLQQDEYSIQGINELILNAKGLLAEIERIAINVESLAKQRAELKKEAWN